MLLIFPLKNHMVIYSSFKYNLKDRWSFSSRWISRKKKIKKRLWWRIKGNTWNYPASVSEVIWNSFFFFQNDFKTVLTPSVSHMIWESKGYQRTEEPGGLQSTGVAKSRTQLSDFAFTYDVVNPTVNES